MAQVSFTENLQRHLSCPTTSADGDTVQAVLTNLFRANPQLRSYVVDDQGRLRRHMALYLNDRVVVDRDGLSDRVSPSDEIFVFQALSGG